MPPLPSCPGLHLLLPSGADAQAPVTSCLLPKSLQLGIPEGTGSGVHASKKSQHRSGPHREARGKSKGLCSSCANSMGKRDFSTNPKMEDLRRNWIHTFSICSSFFFFLALPRVVWDLNSPNRDQTVAPALEAQGLNHWPLGKSLIFLMFHPDSSTAHH